MSEIRALTVQRRTPIDLTKPCRFWTGEVISTGYGRVVVDGQIKFVHRLTYQLHVGPIPRTWEIDHLCHGMALLVDECAPGPCRHRACWEPAHLEAVTSRVNSERGGHPLYVAARSNICRRGHDLTDPKHLTTRPDGRRRCRTCSRMTPDERRAYARANG